MNNAGKIIQLLNPGDPQDAATKSYVDTSIPIGGIIMWSWAFTLPSNWKLCDGTNGTPDLRGRFVLSSGQGSGLTAFMQGDAGLIDLSRLYSFTSHTFDNAGATGWEGPQLATVRTSYTNRGATWATTYLNMTTQGIQEWTVPETGSYTIVAAGASCENPSSFGFGARVTITTTLTKGEIIKILVGQKGQTDGSRGAGGGGTFVVRGTNTPIVVAGGGGGKGLNRTENLNQNAVFSTNGQNGAGNFGVGFGGNAGAGGGSVYGAGGGGLIGNGGNSTQSSTVARGGLSFTNGGIGGQYGGGFGGGGGYGDGSAPSGGGGGGYSGGGGGGSSTNWDGGGGGGSFSITGSFTETHYHNGHGFVVITLNPVDPAYRPPSYVLPFYVLAFIMRVS